MDSLVFGELRRQRKGLRVWAKLKISVWPFEGFFQMVRGRETAWSRERERNEAVRSVEREGKSNVTPRRKVLRPSVGICLNSWGNPPTHTHPCLCFSGGRAGSVC